MKGVMTYTGQSLDGPKGAAVLLRLPAKAIEAVPEGERLVEHPAGGPRAWRWNSAKAES